MTRFTDERKDFADEMETELQELRETAEEMGYRYTEMGGGITALHNHETGRNIIARDYDGVPEDVADPILYCKGESVLEFANLRALLEYIDAATGY